MEVAQKDRVENEEPSGVETEAINDTSDDGSPAAAHPSGQEGSPAGLASSPNTPFDTGEVVDIENLENRPPPTALSAASVEHNNNEEPHGTTHALSVNSTVDLSASMLTAPDDGLLLEDDMTNPNLVASPIQASRLMPGPHREEPTLKEKLVDRERQRRKEAERARLKRQFALMSNGGGLVYDGPPSQSGGGAVRENNSICGTVGEESSVAAHADLDEAIMASPSHNHSNNNPQQNGGDTTSSRQQQQQPQFGYTMERFLQERGGTEPPHPAARALSTSSSVIREETMDDLKSTETPPDKGVVMERFLNDPVLVNTTPALVSEGEGPRSDRGGHDVHRSVSFDVELRTSEVNGDPAVDESPMNADNSSREAMEDQHLSLDESQSNASVRVEVAPEDNLLGPMSMSPDFPSSGTPRMDSIGPSMDQQSTASTNPTNNEADGDNSVDDTEPRVFRLTEAEIQEMAAIEEASIGNAPPSDRDAESLVGELVGDFGTANGMGNDPAGTTYSQGTPTTAMESGSILSGNQNIVQPSSNRQNGHNHSDETDRGSDMDDIDDMAMSAASVTSHLNVSPGASLSGSAVSVTANPPSEIIGRGEPSSTILGGDDDDDDDDDDDNADGGDEEPVPPPRVVLADNHENMSSSNNHNNNSLVTEQVSSGGAAPTRRECENTMQIREELAAAGGPDAAGIVNRRLRPGMVPDSPMRRIVSLPENIHSTDSAENTPRNNRAVDDFDFDKNDFPLSPHSHMSDSVRDLPEDGYWTSPGRKMTVEGGNANRNAKTNSTQLPSLDHTSSWQGQKPIMSLPEEESLLSPSVLAKVECAFGEVRTNQSVTVDAKETEVYIRGDYLSKVFPKRLFPLVMTCLMEIPVMGMISEGSDRLCLLLGRHHQQLLIGFIPLIAALSGNISSQARSLSTKAINYGQISASAYTTWVLEECKVSACLGLGLASVVGAIAFSVASGSISKKLLFALTVAIAQFISAASSGCIGTVSPLVYSFLLKRNANSVSGLAEAAIQDVVSTFFTATFSYYLLSIFVSPSTDPNDSCMAQ